METTGRRGILNAVSCLQKVVLCDAHEPRGDGRQRFIALWSQDAAPGRGPLYKCIGPRQMRWGMKLHRLIGCPASCKKANLQGGNASEPPASQQKPRLESRQLHR